MVDKKKEKEKKKPFWVHGGGKKAPEDVRLGPIYKNIHPP